MNAASSKGSVYRITELIGTSTNSWEEATTNAVEAHPAIGQPGCCATLPLHEHCLFKLGIMLGELWYLTELAAWLREKRRSRFLLTAPPLRLPGAAGSPVTPVATV